jgi:predicted PhzF superfamily epimerase YddE/YHI9
MRTPIFQIGAFTTWLFAGNPAAVMPMDTFPADAVLQAIAAMPLSPAQQWSWSGQSRDAAP